MKRATAVVDLAAIESNLRHVHGLVPEAAVMAVVKADAYGHGMGPVARAARRAGAQWLGVALPSEALALRAHGDEGRVLAWLWAPGDPDLPACVREGIDLSVSTAWAVEEVATAARQVGRPAAVHVKVDTGLSRNGASTEQLPDVLRAAAAAADAGLLTIDAVWSHLAEGDTPDAPSVARQVERFDEACALADSLGIRPRLRHLGNSGSVWAHPQCRFDLVRVGIAMYGLTPSMALGSAADLGLTPAMTLTARLAHVKGIDEGESVGYAGTWSTPSPTAVGLVPLGYADGIPRAAGNRVEVAIGGVRRPIVGRVAMDQFVVDLGSGDAAQVGDVVHLFGSGAHGELTADEWGAALDTIGYEIVTRIGGRVARSYVGAP